jgi:hypothetical protein
MKKNHRRKKFGQILLNSIDETLSDLGEIGKNLKLLSARGKIS